MISNLSAHCQVGNYNVYVILFNVLYDSSSILDHTTAILDVVGNTLDEIAWTCPETLANQFGNDFTKGLFRYDIGECHVSFKCEMYDNCACCYSALHVCYKIWKCDAYYSLDHL